MKLCANLSNRSLQTLMLMVTILSVLFLVSYFTIGETSFIDINKKMTNFSIDLRKFRKFGDWNKNTTRRKLARCPDVPGNLVPTVDPPSRLAELEKNNSYFLNALSPGGTYIPPDCEPSERVAIIVPYRDRQEHLKKFLLYMHAFLQKQKISYTIFIAEQAPGVTFNLGLLHNVGFKVAIREGNFTCFIFQDVDLLPMNETNLYRCSDVPMHFCHINTKFGTKGIIYGGYWGGVVAMTKDQYIRVNGYSNLYFGWGGEDDDIFTRVREFSKPSNKTGKPWGRLPRENGFYYAMAHAKDKGNPINPSRMKLVSQGKKHLHEGLSTLIYTEKAVEKREQYTWVLADVNEYEILKNFSSMIGPLPKLLQKTKTA